MNTLLIFFGEFWPTFVGVSISWSLIWLAHRFASDGHLPFIGPKSFTELAPFSKDEQRRLLHEASKEAFEHWRSFVPSIVFSVLFSFGVAVALTLWTTHSLTILSRWTKLPDSFWVPFVFALFVWLFTAIGAWLAARLEVRYVRRFLRKCIERTSHAGS